MIAASSPQATSKPTRRWYQFSLRTLLLLPTVLALVLSGVYSWPHVHRRYIVWKLERLLPFCLTGAHGPRIGRAAVLVEVMVGA